MDCFALGRGNSSIGVLMVDRESVASLKIGSCGYENGSGVTGRLPLFVARVVERRAIAL